MTKVLHYMSTSLLTVRPESTLKAAYNIMGEKKIRHLLVTDLKSRLLGIISDRDIKKYMSPFAGSSIESGRDRALMESQVSSFMKKEVITVNRDESLKSCITKMLENTIDALAVVDNEGIAIGILTTTDLLKLLRTKLN